MDNLEELNNIAPHMIGAELNDAIRKNEIDKVKYLLKHPCIEEDRTFQHFINISLSVACAKNKLELADLLLNSPDFKYNADINYEDGEALRHASENNHLGIIKYLTTHPKFNFSISMPDSAAIYSACLRGHVEIIEYFHSLPYVEEKFINQKSINFLLLTACEKGQDGVVKHLLTSPKLKYEVSQLDIQAAFKKACDKNNLNVMEYFIFDYKIKQNPYIENYLESSDCNPIAKNLFINRDLNAELSTNESILNKKPKI